MQALAPFQFNSHPVRVVTDETGEPWFVAKDIFDALEMAWAGSQSLGKVRSEWKMTQPLVDPQARTQEVWVINERAVYKLAFRSNKKEAERFTDWVAGEVLPSIRKTGQYSAVPKTFAEALQLAADQARLIESQQEQIQVMAPKADYADRLLGAEETVDLETAAKVLRTSRNRLMAFLRERGILTASRLPAQAYIDRDLMRVQLTPYQDVFGREKVSQKTVLTQRGLLYVRGLLDSFERQRDFARLEALQPH